MILSQTRGSTDSALGMFDQRLGRLYGPGEGRTIFSKHEIAHETLNCRNVMEVRRG